jgi:glycosyltransferase involved in cell wall biosynthesis
LRIAQVAPLYESVPPRYYGGTERIVSYLTEDLVRRGHDVTLYASGDSETRAQLRPVCAHSLRLDRGVRDPLAQHVVMVEQVSQEASEYDIVHYHIDYLHYPSTRRTRQRHLTTLHGRLDLPELVPLYREFREIPLVSISDAQREPLPWANWRATVHHGIPGDLYPFQEEPGSYLAFLGRISPEKGCDRAIEIALRAGLPLKIAAKVADGPDHEYYESTIRPLLRKPGIEFVGEITEQEKGPFLGGARALLFPIDWPEPFGLVMIEAMACGTPVVAFPRGSVPEVLEEGVTARIGQTTEDLVRAVERIEEIDRRRCRETFERRFSDTRMGGDYEQIYRSLLEADFEQVYRRALEGNGSWMK